MAAEAREPGGRAHQCAGALVVTDGAVLLCHRAPARAWFPDVWDIPGGHIEPGESSADTVRRELDEELGITVVVGDRPLARIEGAALDLSMDVWLVTAWAGSPTNRAPEEHDRIAWFTRAEIADLALADESYRPLLEQVLA